MKRQAVELYVIRPERVDSYLNGRIRLSRFTYAFPHEFEADEVVFTEEDSGTLYAIFRLVIEPRQNTID